LQLEERVSSLVRRNLGAQSKGISVEGAVVGMVNRDSPFKVKSKKNQPGDIIN
jgi:hypothetical protein